VEGEYVSGGWKTEPAAGKTALPGTPQPGTQVSLDITWDPALPQHILRWQEGDVFYEILVSAALGRSLDLGQEDLIHLSEFIR
jgi:hypothetical protein